MPTGRTVLKILRDLSAKAKPDYIFHAKTQRRKALIISALKTLHSLRLCVRILPSYLFRRGLLLFSLAVIPILIIAQPCATDFFLQQTLLEQPERSIQYAAIQRFTQQWIAENADPITSRTIVTIPIVVHVVWKNAAENISDAQIISQIEVLNRDFRALNKEIINVPAIFKPTVANIEFQFCLARRTPEGAATTGITRTQTNVNNVGTETITINSVSKRAICYTELGGRDAWDTKKYLNIWLGKFEFGLGEASFPNMADSEADGVRVDPTAFGTIGTASDAPYNLGRTATHEIGHYFNLQHPWGTIEPNCNGDDGVTDTPRQFDDFRGECPTHPQLFCGTASMFMNFMNYSDDACLSMFTNGQKMRMLAALNGFRSGLLNSLGCDAPTTATKEPLLESTVQIIGNPIRERLQLHSTAPNSQVFNLLLVNVQGQIVSKDEWNTFSDYNQDLRNFPIGIYFLILQNENTHFYKKIILTQ